MDIINVERSVMMNFYDKDIDDVLNKLNSDIEGLSKIKVDKRRKSDGFNEITDKVKITAFKRFISQFNNIMIILLLIVGVLSFVYSTVTGTDYTDAIVILFSVVVNAIMGYIQEKKAEDSLENIKTTSPPFLMISAASSAALWNIFVSIYASACACSFSA